MLAALAVLCVPVVAQGVADDAVVSRYASAYAKAGKPRVAIFWNRDFSDQHHADGRVVRRIEGQAERSGGYERRSASFSVSSSEGTEFAAVAKRHSSLPERDLWQVETEFTKRLIEGGTHVIDRAAILRMTAASKGAAPQDPQALETAALVGKADLLLEVLLTADAGAPLGWAFRSNLKDIKTGRVLASGYCRGVPKVVAEPARYEARPGGFELVTPPPPAITAQAAGHALAVEAMGELTLRMLVR